MFLSKHAHPRIDVVDILIEGFQRLGDRRIRIDLIKVGDRWQTEIAAHRVVITKSVVTASLNVQCAKIKSASAWRAKEKISQRVHDHRVRHLLRISRKVPNEWLKTADGWNHRWIEEHALERKGINLDKTCVDYLAIVRPRRGERPVSFESVVKAIKKSGKI